MVICQSTCCIWLVSYTIPYQYATSWLLKDFATAIAAFTLLSAKVSIIKPLGLCCLLRLPLTAYKIRCCRARPVQSCSIGSGGACQQLSEYLSKSYGWPETSMTAWDVWLSVTWVQAARLWEVACSQFSSIYSLFKCNITVEETIRAAHSELAEKGRVFPKYSRLFVSCLFLCAIFIIVALIYCSVKKQKLSNWVGRRSGEWGPWSTLCGNWEQINYLICFQMFSLPCLDVFYFSFPLPIS